ncbi:hypothetical protein LFT45_11740 [Arthrobacter sp. FW305-BF8]|uniref:hypothetical protein n=1 Tax=Arthrobacter sp. FW305-BF8 TaxID=2879617 RepID=UPI001F2C03C2|nr:hypothetical protein [Arthrobacter sp. FW305-BF8]UKA52441.1 hypothetical protein LFT45_11740 [Arthrobacter sp. FW305-BF8]
MSGLGGTRQARILLAGLLVSGSMAGCEYATERDTPTDAVSPATRRPPQPADDPALAARIASNRTKLDQLLGGAPATGLVLADSVLVGGQSMGSSKTGQVPAAGQYTVTFACVGAPDAQLTVSQANQGGSEIVETAFDCGEVSEHAAKLERGPIQARLLRLESGHPSGAVAGFRITSRGR